ncbi:hypothetical protein ACP275_06G175500 [Erythranthe tilingii]
MPPEQVPWDRRDFRKHERSGSDPRFGGGGFGGGGGGGPNRWREQHHHPHAPPPHPPPYQTHHNHQQQRWYSDFRSSRPIPPGQHKQGGWHMYPDESGHGFMPFGSRYGERNLDDDNFRPFGSRGEGNGRYLRNSRENRASFSQKDWRSPSSEPAASSSGPGRPTIEVNNQKSVENNQTSHNNDSKSNDSSHLLPDSLPGQSQPLVKEKHEKDDDIADAPASSGQKTEKENGQESIDWKPLKWTRSGSMPSRSPGVAHSNSSKGVVVDSVEIVAELQHKNVKPVQSPAAFCAVSTAPAPAPAPAPLDENISRKKPRLGWGEGLAKYEKKKVEGPEDIETEYGLVVSVSNPETVKSPSVNLLDKSPRVASSSDCASPATPSSVACSSSPGIEEKESVTAAKVDHDTTSLSCSPNIMSQTNYEGPTFNLENLDLTSIDKLSTLINEFLQSDDPSSVETGYVQTISMNKLLVWKVNILKALEVTESEIDSLETELKSLIAEPRSFCAHPVTSSLLPEDCHLKPGEEQVTDSSFTVGSAPLQVVLPGDMTVENIPAGLDDEHVAVKDEEIDSPGSATSKLVEVLPSGEETVPSVTAECGEELMNLDNDPSNSGTCLEYGLSDEDNACHIVINFENLGKVGCVLCDMGHIYKSVLASNKDSMHEAFEELNKLLPAQQCLFDIPTASGVSSSQSDLSVIKERFLMRKRTFQFKQKVITLKFKVFHHFWKEGRIVSIRKLRGKSHKKFDQSRTGYKKNRYSSRSKFFCSAGSPRTVPAEEVIDFVNRLLSESPFKLCRNTLRMPALILDKEIKMSRFISNNGLVEDPCAAEKEKSIINPWSAEEREIFIDNLAIYGKDFKKIASFLAHKTIADCIEFYYKNHKSECFERARKKPDFAKQSKSQSTTYLVGTGKRWNREANAASLDLLGEASMMAANVNDGIEIQQKCTSRIFFGGSSSQKAQRVDDGPLQRSNSLDMYSNETVAADVLAGICGSLSSEAMSSCITSSVDPAADGQQDWKSQRVSSCVKRPLTPDVTQNIDDECSDESCWEMESADWTDEEKSIFVQAVSTYGKDFAMLSQSVRTRSSDQCKIFFSKARKCLGLDQIQPGGGNAISADINGGGSDIEDACVVQAGSVVCDDAECKMEEDLPPPNMKSSHESGMAGTHDLKPDFKLCEENTQPCAADSMVAELVSQNLSMGDSQVNDNANSRERNGECRSVLENRTLVLSSNTEPVRVEEGNDLGRLNGSNEAALPEVSNGRPCEENDGHGLILPLDNLDNRKVEDRVADSSEVTALNCAAREMKSEPQLAAGNGRHPSVDSQKGADLETTSSAEKSHVIPLRQNGHFALVDSSTLFSVPIKYQRHSSTNALSSVGANGISEKHSQKFAKKGDYQQQQQSLSHSLSDPVESSQILRGYPVPVQTVKEINRDLNWKKHVLHQNVSKSEGKLHSDRHTDFSLQKCSSSKNQGGIVQATFPIKDQSRNDSRPRSGSSSDVDKPSRSGDVKLFGKIIVSSQDKASSCLQENSDSNGPQHKSGSQSLNLKFGSDHKVNIDSSQSKFDYNNYLGSENIALRGFEYTGFPPLPDSTLLLNKYPAAFRNHSIIPTVKLEQQPHLHGLVSNHHHPPLNAVSVYPSGDLQQPFTMDMKKQTQQDVLYSEMQIRNGFDVMQQQQGRGGMVGINVVGRGGGVVVGGQCSSGVSDPVTAIKMHYAKAQNFSIQAGNVIREDDNNNNNSTWRSSGDVGR